MPLIDQWNSSMLGTVQLCHPQVNHESGRPAWSVHGILVGVSHDLLSEPRVPGGRPVETTLTFRVGGNIVQVIAP